MLEYVIKGISIETFNELKKRDYDAKDITPVSPLPILEEAIGALFCILGNYKCFPWKGEILTFINGKPTLVKSKAEIIKKKPASPKNVAADKPEKKGEKKEEKIKEKVKEENKEKIEEEIETEEEILEKCKLKCQYNIDGVCKYNPVKGGETGCEDPMLEIQKMNAKDFTDLL